MRRNYTNKRRLSRGKRRKTKALFKKNRNPFARREVKARQDLVGNNDELESDAKGQLDSATTLALFKESYEGIALMREVLADGMNAKKRERQLLDSFLESIPTRILSKIDAVLFIEKEYSSFNQNTLETKFNKYDPVYNNDRIAYLTRSFSNWLYNFYEIEASQLEKFFLNNKYKDLHRQVDCFSFYNENGFNGLDWPNPFPISGTKFPNCDPPKYRIPDLNIDSGSSQKTKNWSILRNAYGMSKIYRSQGDDEMVYAWLKKLLSLGNQRKNESGTIEKVFTIRRLLIFPILIRSSDRENDFHFCGAMLLPMLYDNRYRFDKVEIEILFNHLLFWYKKYSPAILHRHIEKKSLLKLEGKIGHSAGRQRGVLISLGNEILNRLNIEINQIKDIETQYQVLQEHSQENELANLKHGIEELISINEFIASKREQEDQIKIVVLNHALKVALYSVQRLVKGFHNYLIYEGFLRELEVLRSTSEPKGLIKTSFIFYEKEFLRKIETETEKLETGKNFWQVIQEAIHNAFKHTDRRSEIFPEIRFRSDHVEVANPVKLELGDRAYQLAEWLTGKSDLRPNFVNLDNGTEMIYSYFDSRDPDLTSCTFEDGRFTLKIGYV